MSENKMDKIVETPLRIVKNTIPETVLLLFSKEPVYNCRDATAFRIMHAVNTGLAVSIGTRFSDRIEHQIAGAVLGGVICLLGQEHLVLRRKSPHH